MDIEETGVEQQIIEDDLIQEEELSLMQSHQLHSDTLGEFSTGQLFINIFGFGNSLPDKSKLYHLLFD